MKQTKEYRGQHISLDDGQLAMHFLLDQFPSSAQVDSMELYLDMFPGMQTSDYVRSEGEDPQPNPVLVYQHADLDTGEVLTSQRILFRDRLPRDVAMLIEGNSFALVSGLSYMGRKNRLGRATMINAIIIDVDSVPAWGVHRYLERSSEAYEGNLYQLPRATYISYSGTGMHLYFVFEKPIPLYPNQKSRAKAFKDAITPAFWSANEITTSPTVQYQGISQGFRSPGSVNGKYDGRGEAIVTTVRTGPKVTVEGLAEILRRAGRYDNEALSWAPEVYDREGRMTLAEAKAAYPEWVPGSKGIPKWKSHRSLYDWWLKKITTTAILVGHRYHSMYVLVSMAKKCDISQAELTSDMFTKVLPILEETNNSSTAPPLTEQDARDALATYGLPKIHMLTRADAERLSGLPIPERKKNGFTREQQIKIASMHRDIRHPNGSWRGTTGKGVTKDAVVADWRDENPFGTKAQCIRETGLSKSTVNRHWGDTTPGILVAMREWRSYNPKGSQAQCSHDTGISPATVSRRWNEAAEKKD